MPMTANGLSKLLEECGELTETAALLIQDLSAHRPASAIAAFEDEAADVQAAIDLVSETFQLPVGIYDPALTQGHALNATHSGPSPAAELIQLVAALGALSQIASKKLAYFNTDSHPDGKGSLHDRLSKAVSAVLLALINALGALNADPLRVKSRRLAKTTLFFRWHAEP